MEIFSIKDISSEISAVKSYADPNEARKGTQKESVGLTFNRNGKRLVISQLLAKKLGIKNTASIAVVPSKRLLIIGSDFEGGESFKCSTTSGKPTIYNSTLVSGIVNAMGLREVYDSGRTSLTFDNISYDAEANVAIIEISTDSVG